MLLQKIPCTGEHAGGGGEERKSKIDREREGRISQEASCVHGSLAVEASGLWPVASGLLPTSFPYFLLLWVVFMFYCRICPPTFTRSDKGLAINLNSRKKNETRACASS